MGKVVIKIFEKHKDYFLSKIEKRLGIVPPSLVRSRDCRACWKYRTMDCPNSSMCYATIDKPYFEVVKSEGDVKWKWK